MRIKYLSLTLLLPILAFGSNISNEVTKKATEKGTPTVQSASSYEVLFEEDIVYAKGLSHSSINSANSTEMALKLDVYSPDTTLENRPVFLFIHGGGFSGESKQQERIKEWAQYFASRGWVFISADYRLKKDMGTVPQEWVNYSAQVPQGKRAQFLAIYPAIRDAKAALRWVHANAEAYHINTDFVTIGGGSAGAITAIAMGVTKPEDYQDEISVEDDPTLSTILIDQEYNVHTIIDLWGSNVGLEILENIYGHQRFDANDPALFIAHGTEDPTVPFSKAIDLKAAYDKSGAPYIYYPLEGKGHGAWDAIVDGKSLDKLAFDFIVEQQVLKVE